MKQIVRVAFDASSRTYTYGWYHPTVPLKEGDVVEVPPNAYFPEGGRVGTVAGIGSSYTGPLAWIVKKVDVVESPKDECRHWKFPGAVCRHDM